jgi:hypothetical protein
MFLAVVSLNDAASRCRFGPRGGVNITLPKHLYSFASGYPEQLRSDLLYLERCVMCGHFGSRQNIQKRFAIELTW